MLQHSTDPALDRVFLALADSTRRAMIEQLSAGPLSVSQLAAPHDVTLTAIGQHVSALEASGLVRTQKVGRVRTVSLEPRALERAERWLLTHRARWERRLDALGALLAEEDDDEASEKPRERASRRPAPRQTRKKRGAR
jgi:DNA-binding transcriptional ArsR family regulator